MSEQKKAARNIKGYSEFVEKICKFAKHKGVFHLYQVERDGLVSEEMVLFLEGLLRAMPPRGKIPRDTYELVCMAFGLELGAPRKKNRELEQHYGLTSGAFSCHLDWVFRQLTQTVNMKKIERLIAEKKEADFVAVNPGSEEKILELEQRLNRALGDNQILTAELARYKKELDRCREVVIIVGKAAMECMPDLMAR